MTRRERLERRLERREEWAAKARKRSAEARDRVSAIADNIPLGQPILVGHHSEKRARRDRERIRAGFERSSEERKLAERHASKASGLGRQLEHSIFSDDADAIERLKEKIAALESRRDREKKINALWRKGGADAMRAGGISEKLVATAERTMSLCSWLKAPCDTTNTSAEIRRCKKRIEEIERRNKRTAEAEASGGVKVELTGEYARVTFAEKPARDVINALKSAGYWWRGGCWSGPAAALPAQVRELGGAQ